MSESISGKSCPECGISFDIREEPAAHSRRQHATISETKGNSKAYDGNPSFEERIQARTEGGERERQYNSLRVS